MRARTGTPSSSAFCADISTTAAPASFMPEAFPAVTVPSGLNTGFSLPRPSIVAYGRTCAARAALRPGALPRVDGAVRLEHRLQLAEPLHRGIGAHVLVARELAR